MKRISFILIVVSVFYACKKEDNKPSNSVNSNISKCSTKTVTLYDINNNIAQQATYFYTGIYADSVTGVSGNTKSKTIYIYNTDKTERKSEFYSNGIKQEYYYMEKLDSYGNVTESYGVTNGNKGVRTVTTYQCN